MKIRYTREGNFSLTCDADMMRLILSSMCLVCDKAGKTVKTNYPNMEKDTVKSIEKYWTTKSDEFVALRMSSRLVNDGA